MAESELHPHHDLLNELYSNVCWGCPDCRSVDHKQMVNQDQCTAVHVLHLNSELPDRHDCLVEVESCDTHEKTHGACSSFQPYQHDAQPHCMPVPQLPSRTEGGQCDSVGHSSKELVSHAEAT